MNVQHDDLSNRIGLLIQEHFSHEGGMTFNADELIEACVGNLAIYLSLIPVFQTRQARRSIAKNVAAALEAMMADAATDPELAEFRGAVTAIEYTPGAVQ